MTEANINVPRVTIALAGLGTVGRGLVELLELNHEDILRRTGKEIILKTVAVRDVSVPRKLPAGTVLTADTLSIAEDPDVDIIVELIGGTGMAADLIRKALENGKSVVTANKALLAEHGQEFFSLAARKGVSLAYEASTAGAIPIVQTLKESLSGNRITGLHGILNGTSNYILTEMSSKGADFAPTLRTAQELGIAEADPTLDIDGFDAAHKLIILIRLAWGVQYPLAALPISGIRGMDPLDIKFARELGYRIKLLGEARERDGAIDASVSPCLVRETAMLAHVDGAFNAIHVTGNAVGSLFLQGLGAGSRPTASSVLGDLIGLIRGHWSNTGFAGALPAARILPAEESYRSWYIRLTVHDDYGVLRDIAGTAAENGVSIAQVIQKADIGSGVPLVFLTHETSRSSITAVLGKLMQSGMLTQAPVCYGILN